MKEFQPLIISILVHAWVLTLLYIAPSKPMGDQSAPIEITYLPENKKTFVADPETELQEELQKLEDKVNRLSRVTRRVQREQVAQARGETRNTPADSSRAERARRPEVSQRPPRFSAKELIEKERQASSAPSIEKRFSHGVAKNLALGNSSIAEYVPEVRQGGFTSLNTDQFLHYTFYARINEQIRNRWMTAIRQAVASMAAMELQQLSRKTQVTQVEVLLSPEGHFVNAVLHRGADREELDEAVLSAFRLAAPFMNPPEEIVGEDGYIHLHYGFYVEFRPRYVAGSK